MVYAPLVSQDLLAGDSRIFDAGVGSGEPTPSVEVDPPAQNFKQQHSRVSEVSGILAKLTGSPAQFCSL